MGFSIINQHLLTILCTPITMETTSGAWESGWRLGVDWDGGRGGQRVEPCFFHTEVVSNPWGYPNNEWFLLGKIPFKWMIWGYPYFRTPPYIYIYICIGNNHPTWTWVIFFRGVAEPHQAEKKNQFIMVDPSNKTMQHDHFYGIVDWIQAMINWWFFIISPC